MSKINVGDFMTAISSEISTCLKISPQCVFILGFARSSTTVVTQIINTSNQAYLLGEANFYMNKSGINFRNDYNQQHVTFENQVTKSTYAPDFLSGRDNLWWEWLSEAANLYAVVGDKMAFSALHFSLISQEALRSFLESRFFMSRYIFLFRNPKSTLLSTMRLMGSEDQSFLVKQIDAWLQFVQLWADMLRTFPHSLTIVTDDLDQADVSAISTFIGLPLIDASLLLNTEQKRIHNTSASFPILNELDDDLNAVFEAVKASLNSPRVLWQVEQKRSFKGNDTRQQSSARTLVVPRPIGQAWAQAQAIRDKLVAPSL